MVLEDIASHHKNWDIKFGNTLLFDLNCSELSMGLQYYVM